MPVVRPTEAGLVRACLAAIALRVADDSFFQPEPGTSATDHLASGLVPVAVLVAVGCAYPRWRPGARGAVALVLGAFGIATGIEGAYAASQGIVARADFTGLLALGAGSALLAIGAAVLWRSRRGGSRKRRYLRRSLLALGGIVAAYLLVYPVTLAYVTTHVARIGVPAPDLGATAEAVSFTTSDGLVLAGWYVPSRNGAAVIAFPGRTAPQPHARMLVRHGYGVLLFDRRGEGASEGDPNALGWEGHRDVDAAFRFLGSRADVDSGRIGGLGLSVGGEMLIDAAARSGGLRAVVSEGAGIRSVREALDIPDVAPRIQLSLLFGVVTPAVMLFSGSRPPTSLTDLVGRIAPRALFLVEAEQGQGGETELTRTFFDAAGEPKTRWRVPASSHTGGLDAEPAEYERRVVGFFDRHLLGGG